jgi:hypothetical protein
MAEWLWLIGVALVVLLLISSDDPKTAAWIESDWQHFLGSWAVVTALAWVLAVLAYNPD